jgi:hypothetical protein
VSEKEKLIVFCEGERVLGRIVFGKQIEGSVEDTNVEF